MTATLRTTTPRTTTPIPDPVRAALRAAVGADTQPEVPGARRRPLSEADIITLTLAEHARLDGLDDPDYVDAVLLEHVRGPHERLRSWRDRMTGGDIAYRVAWNAARTAVRLHYSGGVRALESTRHVPCYDVAVTTLFAPLDTSHMSTLPG